MKRVMIFGTFDMVHDGHRHLLQEATMLAEEVYVVVARDEHVLELKGALPENGVDVRMEVVAYESEVTEVVMGDKELGTYGVVREHEPDVVLFGYDQDDLKMDFQSWCEDEGVDVTVQQASSYMPDVFKTSIMMDQYREEVEV